MAGWKEMYKVLPYGFDYDHKRRHIDLFDREYNYRWPTLQLERRLSLKTLVGLAVHPDTDRIREELESRGRCQVWLYQGPISSHRNPKQAAYFVALSRLLSVELADRYMALPTYDARQMPYPATPKRPAPSPTT